MLFLRPNTRWLFLFSLLLSWQAQALYYTLPQPKQTSEASMFRDAPLTSDFLQTQRSQMLSLTSWVVHNQDWAEPSEHYNRKKHFGGWAKREGCMNTRALVLRRDSKTPVTMTSSGCSVDSGDWVDPYSGEEFQSAKDIQIDHMVPLKQAYLTGGSQWTQNQRCMYANFLGTPEHLIPVSGTQNESKGDMTPGQWLPPNREYDCQYIGNWLRIKLVWNLVMPEDEGKGILQALNTLGCNSAAYQMDPAEVMRLRSQLYQAKALCQAAQEDSAE